MFLEVILDTVGIGSLLSLLIKVVLWSLIISSPFIIAILVMYGYKRYKKWSNSEDKESERIILGRAKKITQYDEELTRQSEALKKKQLEEDLLDIRLASKKKELGESEKSEEDSTEDKASGKIDLSKMNIKELKQLAKERKIPMFSKLNKQQLLNKLQEVIAPGKTK
ncbi:MAG: Rho termination factor N-terminal domain-containing protein [Tenericutes bacterium]|nr:Rho termination factor N-terminal domain-containing protein [Mycoplasmatota bacterium]